MFTLADSGDLGVLARRERDQAGFNQRKVAELAGVDPSTLSRAERGYTGVLQTAIRVLNEVFGFVIEENARYHIKRFPRQELAGREKFESLDSHFKVLYFVTWFGRGCHFTDFLREFPGLPQDTVQYLEASTFRLRIGQLNARLVSATNDLIEDGLIEVKNIRAYSIERLKERRQKDVYDKNTSKGGIDESFRINNPGLQDETCWYINENKSRYDLSEHKISYRIVLTEKGDKIWNILPSLKASLDKESLLGKPMNND